MIGCTYPDCGKLIENRDKNLCATHNKAFRGIVKPKKLYPIKPKKQKAIAKHSVSNFHETSTGERVSSAEVEKNIHDAKAKILGKMMYEHNYHFCEFEENKVKCEVRGVYLDCAHLISVDQCKKKGIVEYAWDTENIKVFCREHHAKYDRNNLRFTVNETKS